MFWPLPMSLAAIFKSYIPTMLTMAVSLMTVIISLPRAGMMFLMAWGATILKKMVDFLRPRARPASVWPMSTERMPPRMISAV